MARAVNGAAAAPTLRRTPLPLLVSEDDLTTPTTAPAICRGLATGGVLSDVASLYAGARQSQASVTWNLLALTLKPDLIVADNNQVVVTSLADAASCDS